MISFSLFYTLFHYSQINILLVQERMRLDLINNFIYLLLIFFMFLTVSTLRASVYDDDVLDIFSKILPRFILMSSQKNTIKDKIDICILHDKIDERDALLLIDKIDVNNPNGIKNYKINLINSSYSNMDVCRNTQLMFMFNTSEQNIERGVKFSKNHTIFTISYNSKYLENGVNASLFLGRKVAPYINMSSINDSGLVLDNVLVRVSKIYTKEDAQ